MGIHVLFWESLTQNWEESVWIVTECTSVFRPAQFFAHFLFLVLADERFSYHIKSGIVSARGYAALGTSPVADC